MNPKIKLTILIAAAVVALAGAAYFGMQFIFPGAAASLGLPVLRAGGKQQFRIEVNRSPELPAADPDVDGTITSEQDNSLFFTIFSKGNSDPSASSGPINEVVITRDTKLLRDATLDSVNKQDIIRNNGATLDMVVEPMAIKDIQAGDIIQVWGEKRGDRWVATDVLVMVNVSKIDPTGGK